MPKKDLNFPDQVNFLNPAGTIETLIAIAFYRGDLGRYGSAARDMLAIGINHFLSSLSQADKKRFNEILESVRVSQKFKRDNP